MSGAARSRPQKQALWLGSLSDAFENEEACRDAWERHRASMLHLFGNHGRRPVGWWQCDPEAAELTYPGYDSERSYLFDHGVLGPEEAARLIAYWRGEFERANAPGFAYCRGSGPDGWLRGEPARQAHYQWADIPESLIAKWGAGST